MERWIDDGERGERGNGKIDRKMDAWLGGRVGELVASINKWMNRCMAGCWLNEWMDGWMNGWMVREMKSLEVRRDIKRWMNTGQLPFCNSPFSFFLPLSPTSLHSRIFGLCLAMSLFLCLREALSLPFPLSLSLSLILTRWVIAVALWLDWLMHSKSPGRWSTTNRRRREKKKSERQDWREKNGRESGRMSVCVCVFLPLIETPFWNRCIKWFDSQREVPFPSSDKVFSLFQFRTIMLTHTVWPISQQWDSCEGTDGEMHKV